MKPYIFEEGQSGGLGDRESGRQMDYKKIKKPFVRVFFVNFASALRALRLMDFHHQIGLLIF
jgi:hypothetical protein